MYIWRSWKCVSGSAEDGICLALPLSECTCPLPNNVRCLSEVDKFIFILVHANIWRNLQQQMLDLLFWFQMRLLKRLSKLINMFGASLQCTVWQGHKCHDELWSRCKQGGIQFRGTCAKRQSNRNIWPCQPLMTGSWFFSCPSSSIPTLDTDRFMVLDTKPSRLTPTSWLQKMVMMRRKKRWRRRSTSWGP